jgi:hypothetical protein
MTDEFYEDDEDPQEVREAFERAEKGLTYPPQMTWTSGSTVSVTWGPNGPTAPVRE